MKGTNSAWGKRGTKIQVSQPPAQTFLDKIPYGSRICSIFCGTFNSLENEGSTGLMHQSKAAIRVCPAAVSSLPRSLQISETLAKSFSERILKEPQIIFSSLGQDTLETGVPGMCTEPSEKRVCSAFVWPPPRFSPCLPVPRTLVLGTPEMRVIHAGLVIGDSDERPGWASVLDELVQHLLVVDGEVVHVLWRERQTVGRGLGLILPGSQGSLQPS